MTTQLKPVNTTDYTGAPWTCFDGNVFGRTKEGGGVVLVATLSGLPSHVQRANGRLIAASPVMLAACKKSLDALLAAFPHADRIPDILQPAIDEVRQAIAAAEGGGA